MSDKSDKMIGVRMTRRSVLSQASLAGLASLASPYLIPSGVLARAGRTGANDRIVIAGIGVRRMGAALIREGFARFEDVRVAAVADVDLRNAESISKPRDEDKVLFAIPFTPPTEPADLRDVVPYQDYRRILDRQDIDAVVIGTPEHWHGLISIHAAQAGKDVYCEKPASLTVREGRLMVEAMRKYDRVFQTGTQRRSQVEWEAACAMVRQGRLGKIQRVIDGNYASPYQPPGLKAQPIPDKLDWDMWNGPVQPIPYHESLITGNGGPTWREYKEFAGRWVTNTGSHTLDLVQWGLGMDESGPIEVWTEGEQPFDMRTGSGPNVFLRYPGDVILDLTGAVFPRFIGEKGTLMVDTKEARIVTDPPELAEEPVEGIDPQAPRGGNHYAHCRDWIECIKTRRKPHADIEIGHRTATVCHLVNIARFVSARTGETGQRMQWDPQAERFTNCEWGNHYLDRPYRRPYHLPDQL
jgi:predicted dehydrogenase